MNMKNKKSSTLLTIKKSIKKYFIQIWWRVGNASHYRRVRTYQIDLGLPLNTKMVMAANIEIRGI